MSLIISLKLAGLALIAMASAVIDTMAGGGGLICVPALLLFGLSPITALATNKLQANFGSATAAAHFMRVGRIGWRDVVWGVLWSFIGAVAGTLMIEQIHSNLLATVIPILLLGVWLYVLLSPKLGIKAAKQRLSYPFFFFVFGLLLGFYDGFLGPATGSFWAIAMMGLLGWQMKQATMYTKIYNFTSNFASLIFFMWAGHVNYRIGLAMGVGQVVGARIGAGLVLSRGAQIIRPVLLTMTAIMMLVLFYQQLQSLF